MAPGDSAATKIIKVKVRNADVSPKPEKPGHAVRLAVTDGTCPAGTVVGLPDFDPDTAGDQDSISLQGGKSKPALVRLNISAANFPGAHAHLAPRRCRLLHVDSALAGNVNPNPSSGTVWLELNVFDANDTTPPAAHESVIKSIAPARLHIAPSASQATKDITAKVVNAGSSTTTDMITVSASDGDCPQGTVSGFTQQVLPPAGGESTSVTTQAVVKSKDFTSPNKKSPARCTAVLKATGANDPDASNNTTNLVIEVTDKNDF